MDRQRAQSIQAGIDMPVEYDGGLLAGGATVGAAGFMRAAGVTAAEVVNGAKVLVGIENPIAKVVPYSYKYEEKLELAVLTAKSALLDLLAPAAGAGTGGTVTTLIEMYKPDNLIPGNTPCKDYGNGVKSGNCER